MMKDFIRPCTVLLLSIQLLTTSFVLVHSDNDAGDGGGRLDPNGFSDFATDICQDGVCTCDHSADLFLISCDGNKLDGLYSEEEWMSTVEVNNVKDRFIDFSVRLNHIYRIPIFPRLKIISLSFQRNWISDIDPYAFAQLDQLTSLDLSENRLTSARLNEKTFCGYDSSGSDTEDWWNSDNGLKSKFLALHHLNLSNNQIHSLPVNSLTCWPQLSTLDLSNNPLKVLGTTGMEIAFLSNLRSLYLTNSELRDIPGGTFHDLKQLTYLDLSGNKFTFVPEEILNTQALRVLILDNNLFEYLDGDSFYGLDSLIVLSISHMTRLKLIEQRTFGTLTNLTVLKCNHNRQLSRISGSAFYDITSTGGDEAWPLLEMWLNDNALTSLDKELAAWHMMEYIDIQNNPFRCNCDIQWMAQTLVQQIVRTQPSLGENIKCHSPEWLKGADIVELGLEDQRFVNCSSGSFRHELYHSPSPSPQEDSIDWNAWENNVGFILYYTGWVLTTIGLSVLAFIAVKHLALSWSSRAGTAKSGQQPRIRSRTPRGYKKLDTIDEHGGSESESDSDNLTYDSDSEPLYLSPVEGKSPKYKSLV